MEKEEHNNKVQWMQLDFEYNITETLESNWTEHLDVVVSGLPGSWWFTNDCWLATQWAQISENTCGPLTFCILPSPLGEVTFWIALQVGKISNGACLHMAASVHTSFVWGERFPPGRLAGLSLPLWGPGDEEAPSCTTCGSCALGFISELPPPHTHTHTYLTSLAPPHHQLPLTSDISDARTNQHLTFLLKIRWMNVQIVGNFPSIN